MIYQSEVMKAIEEFVASMPNNADMEEVVEFKAM